MAYKFFTTNMHVLCARYQRLLPEKLSSWLQIISRILEDKKLKQNKKPKQYKTKTVFWRLPSSYDGITTGSRIAGVSAAALTSTCHRSISSPPINGSSVLLRCLVSSCTQGPLRPAECLPVAMHTNSHACLPRGWQWYRRSTGGVNTKDYDPLSGIVSTALGSSVYRTVTSCQGALFSDLASPETRIWAKNPRTAAEVRRAGTRL